MTNFKSSQEVFGETGGRAVNSFKVSSDSGVSFTVVDYGATLVSVTSPDCHGKSEEITLNYGTLEDMIANHGPYYGCIAGRFANRIAKGKFVIDSTEYTVAVNNGENHLHGGIRGFDQVVWSAKLFADEGAGCAGVELNYVSVDGEEGYPGNLEVYSLPHRDNLCTLTPHWCVTYRSLSAMS
jgi:aldose 1-epimerase